MVLCESIVRYLKEEILTYYDDDEKIKAIFTSHQETFDLGFYTRISGNDLNTKIINLINELIIKNKVQDFVRIIREEYKYNLFANDLPQKELIQVLNDNFEDNREILLKAYQLHKCEVKGIESPKNATELINGLTIPKKEKQTHSYMEKFVGYLLLIELNLSLSLKIKNSLKEWAKENIKNYDKLKELLIQENEERKQQNSFLIVKISSKGRSYIMNAWEMIDPYKHGRNYSTCKQVTIQKKDRVTAEITIKKDLSNFSKELKKFIDQCENLKQIQIFLPDKLMYHAVDYHDLSLGEGDWKTKLGEQYEVIIRSLDRLQLSNKHALKQKWLNKGKIFQQRWEELAGSIFINSDDKADYETFDRRLNNDPELIAVYFTNVIEVKQLKDHILLSGIPLALWIREQLPDNNQDTIDNCIINILRTQQLKDLPVQVKIEKGKNTIISKHLCLLWDDPNLLPPQQNLTDTKL
jgi:hypothetical protein